MKIKSDNVPLNTLLHADCMDIMRDIPDKYFELAIVDPPYGIGQDGQKLSICKNPKHSRKEHKQKNWDDEIPSELYFAELFRVSKHQIIWGGNYFTEYLPSTRGWVFWFKGQNDLTMSDGELAWTSLDTVTRQVNINRVELLKENTFHPTQKPIKLYKYLLKRFANPSDKILDTHAGSCSSVIACIDYGFEYLAIEKDKDYYNEATKRINNHKSQMKLFV